MKKLLVLFSLIFGSLQPSYVGANENCEVCCAASAIGGLACAQCCLFIPLVAIALVPTAAPFVTGFDYLSKSHALAAGVVNTVSAGLTTGGCFYARAKGTFVCGLNFAAPLMFATAAGISFYQTYGYPMETDTMPDMNMTQSSQMYDQLSWPYVASVTLSTVAAFLNCCTSAVHVKNSQENS